MIQPGAHIADETLSALLDAQLQPREASLARAHLATCPACEQRLQGLRSVVDLLRALPAVEAPREFMLGPRLAIQRSNVTRLRRWYGVARTGAASLAAVFVLLSFGAVYLDAQPAPTTLSTSASSQAAAPAPQPLPTLAARAAAPQRASAPAGAAAVRSAGPTPVGADPADQVAAATSVRPLPTPIPTPAAPPPVEPTPPAAAAALDRAAPLRSAALMVGLLTVLASCIALVMRRRLDNAPNP